MKHLSRRLPAKIVAWVLLAVVLCTGLLSGFGTAIWYSYGGQYDGGAYLREQLLRQVSDQLANKVFDSYYSAVKYETSDRMYWENRFSGRNSNFGFVLTDKTGEVLLRNFTVLQPQFTHVTRFTTPTNAQYTINEFYDNYEEAAQRREALYSTEDYIEDVRISEVDWRFGITCMLQTRPSIEVPAVESIPVEEGEPPVTLIEPLEAHHEGEGYYTYYFDTEEDLEAWLMQQSEEHEVYTQNRMQEPTRFELYARCFETEVLTLSAEIPVRSEMAAMDEIWFRLELVQFLLDCQALLIPGLVLSCVLFLLLVIFLFCGAGRRYGSEEVHLRWCDRIPLEFLLFAGVLLCCVPILIVEEIYADCAALLALAVLVPVVLICIWILCSCVVRLKARCFWRSTIVGWLLYLLWRGLRAAGRGIAYVVQGLPLVWQVALAWLVLCFIELFLILAFNSEEALWILERIALTPLLLIVAIQLARLRKGARRIADGDLSTQIDLRYMVGDIRRHGQDLNRITDGLQSAVDERMRSERLKTELITNVSHDIKTPLTSIVNYVDLLSQEEMPSENAKEYLEVLKRQSARLRKLTEDLVEASKAATGNVEARPEVMDVNVLLTQTLGEFEEKLRSLDLEPVLNPSEEPLNVFADGRLLWRVFDNLMSNICKYALPGTRVYLSAQRVEGQVEIVFRNISRYPLNVSSDELIERFVRGDASRSTEGSGLGLSIAKSLTDLQGGQFDLIVDGDLFKAIVIFPAV